MIFAQGPVRPSDRIAPRRRAGAGRPGGRRNRGARSDPCADSGGRPGRLRVPRDGITTSLKATSGFHVEPDAIILGNPAPAGKPPAEGGPGPGIPRSAVGKWPVPLRLLRVRLPSHKARTRAPEISSDDVDRFPRPSPAQGPRPSVFSASSLRTTSPSRRRTRPRRHTVLGFSPGVREGRARLTSGVTRLAILAPSMTQAGVPHQFSVVAEDSTAMPVTSFSGKVRFVNLP